MKIGVMSSPKRAHEAGDGGEVRCTVPGQREKGDVLAAGTFDAPAADNALRIGEQDHLEQHRWWVRRGAGLVIAITGVEIR